MSVWDDVFNQYDETENSDRSWNNPAVQKAWAAWDAENNALNQLNEDFGGLDSWNDDNMNIFDNDSRRQLNELKDFYANEKRRHEAALSEEGPTAQDNMLIHRNAKENGANVPDEPWQMKDFFSTEGEDNLWNQINQQTSEKYKAMKNLRDDTTNKLDSQLNAKAASGAVDLSGFSNAVGAMRDWQNQPDEVKAGKSKSKFWNENDRFAKEKMLNDYGINDIKELKNGDDDKTDEEVAEIIRSRGKEVNGPISTDSIWRTTHNYADSKANDYNLTDEEQKLILDDTIKDKNYGSFLDFNDWTKVKDTNDDRVKTWKDLANNNEFVSRYLGSYDENNGYARRDNMINDDRYGAVNVDDYANKVVNREINNLTKMFDEDPASVAAVLGNNKEYMDEAANKLVWDGMKALKTGNGNPNAPDALLQTVGTSILESLQENGGKPSDYKKLAKTLSSANAKSLMDTGKLDEQGKAQATADLDADSRKLAEYLKSL